MNTKIFKKTPRFLIFIVMLMLINVIVHMVFFDNGIVKDAETHVGLKEAIVLSHLYYLIPTPREIIPVYARTEGTHTSDSGNYSFPLRFHLLAPIFCLMEKRYTYFKEGYFEINKDTNGNVELYKMTHYLNYAAYIGKHQNYAVEDLTQKSKLYRLAVDKMKQHKPLSQDERGVFFRSAGKNFTRIFGKVDKSLESYQYPGNAVFYVFDEKAKNWIVVDSRGKLLQMKEADVPKWDYMSSTNLWGWSIYATRNEMFYPTDEVANPTPTRKIRYMSPRMGNISAIAGLYDNFFTIEADKTQLCNYGRGGQCFKGEHLPDNATDNTTKMSKFERLVETANSGFFVLTKTPIKWDVYQFDKELGKSRAYLPGERNKFHNPFREVVSFSAKKDITAFATTGNEFYFAFRDEGIRKYIFNVHDYFAPLIEDRTFEQNSDGARYSVIHSLFIGSAVNMSALYATTGEDTILRFSLDGIPDYRVQLNE